MMRNAFAIAYPGCSNAIAFPTVRLTQFDEKTVASADFQPRSSP